MFAPIFMSIRDFFADLKWGGERIPLVFAGPDRAHVEMTKIMRRRLQGKKTNQQIEDSPNPRPFMSLYFTAPTYDAARSSLHTFRGFNVDKVNGNALTMRYPRPVTSDVQLDLWCGDAGHIISQSIQGQLHMMFMSDSVYLPIDWNQAKWYKPPFNVLEHARVLGRTRVRLSWEGGWSDSSNLEVGDGPKDVRCTWSGRVEAYLPYRPEEARLLRDLRVEVYNDSETPAQLLTTYTKSAEE